MLNYGRRKTLIIRRIDAEMTQCEVAAKIGVSQSHYNLIEQGYTNPKNDEVRAKLCEMFGLEPGYFDRPETIAKEA